MTRTELREFIAEMRRRNPDLEIAMRRRLAGPRGPLGDRYHQVDVEIRTTQTLNIAVNDPTPVETALELAQGEIDALREATGERALATARHNRLLREARHNPIARRLIESPLAVYGQNLWQPSTERPTPIVDFDPAPRTVARPMQIRFPIQEIQAHVRDTPPQLPPPQAARNRPHLMLRPPVSLPIEPGGPRRPVSPPGDPEPEGAPEPAAPTLWERLEDT